MAPAAVSLSEMVDLAIGSPEVGAVNFSVLHGLLHAILSEIGIGKVKAEIPPDAVASKPRDSDSQSLSKRRKKKKEPEPLSPDADGTGRHSDAGSDSDNDPSDKVPIPLTYMPYHKLADKLNQLEKKFEDLESLPSNSELMERAKGGDKDKLRPMADMWQGMQMARKVDANTEGISKLMSLTEDLMDSLQKLKDENEALKKEMENKQNAGEFEDLKAKLGELEKFRKDCEDRFSAIESLIPDRDFFDNFVTWSGLEDALKGLRLDMENQQQAAAPVEPPPVQQPIPSMRREETESDKLSERGDRSRPGTSDKDESGGGTPPRLNEREGSRQTLMPPVQVDRPSSSHDPRLTPRPKSTQRSSRTATPGPSPELQDLLEKLGKLTNRHDVLEVRVDRIEDELSKKLSKEDFEKLGLTDDILRKLNQLMNDIQAMKNDFSRDTESMKRMEDALQDLRTELIKLTDKTEKISENVRENERNTQKALSSCEELWEKKADKEYVTNELQQKADKEALDRKIDRSEFNSTLEDLYRLITELKEILAGSEADWKKAIEQLQDELEGKIDRRELEALRDDLQKQLKALAKRVAALKADSMNEDDAAGIRKPLRFHCISCDKKVDMTPQKPVPSLPGGYALPENRSMRPHLVYELDQIRQNARGTQPGYSVDGADPYATNRQCGGSHTITYPHKRQMKNGLYPPYQAFDDNNFRSALGYQARLREEEGENFTENGKRSRSRSATRLPNVYETSNKTSQPAPPRVSSARTPQPGGTSRPTSSGPRRAQASVNGSVNDEQISDRKSSMEQRSKTMSDIEVRSSRSAEEREAQEMNLEEADGADYDEGDRSEAVPSVSVTPAENRQASALDNGRDGAQKSRNGDKSESDAGSVKSSVSLLKVDHTGYTKSRSSVVRTSDSPATETRPMSRDDKSPANESRPRSRDDAGVKSPANESRPSSRDDVGVKSPASESRPRSRDDVGVKSPASESRPRSRDEVKAEVIVIRQSATPELDNSIVGDYSEDE